MNLSHRIIENVEQVLLGKHESVRLAVSAFLAEGHLLIDDIPGVGKTTLALALAKSVGCRFQRIQFTSDLLPTDVLGVSVYNLQTQAFDFKPGPVFHNIILADEINRASPKTQSALLESMQEGQVSLDNETHTLPRPFFVIATENPHEHHGTFPLPESQLDRFMMRISLGYPETEVEAAILKGDSRSVRVNHLQTVANAVEVNEEIERIRRARVDESLDQYMIELARLTRESTLIDLGLSPRGTLALRRAAQAYASTEERDYVIPDDIKAVAVPVMAHRMRLQSGNYNGNSARMAESVVREILGQVPVPR
ncbi:MAG: AAA family ATPase [Elusimicrobia bacterium]|nr:AAA family ATPase [Candidatus Obscuribacterium magneticum]